MAQASLKGRTFARKKKFHTGEPNENKPMKVRQHHMGHGMLLMGDNCWWTREELEAAGWYLKKKDKT